MRSRISNYVLAFCISFLQIAHSAELQSPEPDTAEVISIYGKNFRIPAPEGLRSEEFTITNSGSFEPLLAFGAPDKDSSIVFSLQKMAGNDEIYGRFRDAEGAIDSIYNKIKNTGPGFSILKRPKYFIVYSQSIVDLIPNKPFRQAKIDAYLIINETFLICKAGKLTATCRNWLKRWITGYSPYFWLMLSKKPSFFLARA